MYNVNSSVEFNNAVNNTKLVIREARHMNVIPSVNNWIDKVLIIFLDNVNFKVEFVEDADDYLRSKVLDLLDVLKDMMETEGLNGDSFKVINSIYDIFHEYYFEA